MKNLLKSVIQKVIILLIIVVGAVSCQQTPKTITDKLGQDLITEKLYDNTKVTADTAVIYSFYLPKAYDGKTKLPVIFFFDPHANGSLPINNYSQLANKYGYIFVASNNIMNGQSAGYTREVFLKLLSDAKNRFSIDENRLFTAGFSGGAKIATFFAQQMPKIAGVVACGAGIPITNDIKPNYYYAGIVGNNDFNYLEVQQTFTIFNQQGFDFTSVVFDGGHHWPSVNSFEMAIIGFDIYSIKTKHLTKNNEWLDDVWTKMNDSISYFNNANAIIKENVYISQSMRWFQGLRNTNILKKRSIIIMQSQRFNQLIKNHQKLIQTEVKLRSEFIRAIELRNLDWWSSEIEHINKSIAQNNSEVAQVSQRLLNYISMVSFMLVKNNLDNNQVGAAEKKLEIYALVDPNNPDVHLMYARYYLLQNNIEAMKHSFVQAQKLGFNDYKTYKLQPSWSSLFAKDEIKILFDI